MTKPSRMDLNGLWRLGILTGLTCSLALSTAMAQSTNSSPAAGMLDNPAKNSAASTVQAPPSGAALMPGNYRIGEGDVLTINLFDTPEFSGVYAVSDKEEINFPLLGIVKVGGLRANESAVLLQNLLIERNVLRYPQVNVMVSSFTSQGISVLGEVAHPGVYSTNGSQRLLDLVSLASGFTPVAGSTALIRHKRDKSDVSIQIRSRDGEINSAEVQLEPGDTIIIQRAPVIYIMGDVGKPGGFVVDRGKLSVLEGMALAGGPLKTSGHDLRIIHTHGGTVEYSTLNLDRLIRGKTPDPILESGDIVYVPNSMLKAALEIGIPSIVASTASAIIYSRLR